MKKQENKPTFNTIPHSIKEDFFDREKPFNVPEKNILLHLRMIADIYGVVFISAERIRQEVFNNEVKRGTVNKHLTSLRNQGYIEYQDRKGSGGTFKTRIDEWLIKDSVWTHLEDMEKSTSIGGSKQSVGKGTSEALKEVSQSNRKSKHDSNIENKGSNFHSMKSIIGGSYKDIEKDKDKDNNDYQSFSSKETIDTTDFEVKSHIDDKLLRIAEAVGEKSMDFILGFYKKHKERGLRAMERAAASLQDAPDVKDRGRWFNKMSHEYLS